MSGNQHKNYLYSCDNKAWSCQGIGAPKVQGEVFSKGGYHSVKLCRDHLGGYAYKMSQQPEKFGSFSISAAVRPSHGVGCGCARCRIAGVT